VVFSEIDSAVWYREPSVFGIALFTYIFVSFAILENFRGLRKFSIELKYSNRRIDSRQGAKHAKFGGER
jgi:hypothetical protein